jgi:hypothetical protein
MRTRLRLLQKWRQVVEDQLIGVRKTQREVLARFVVGVLLSGTVLLPRVAQAMPHTVRTASGMRRLRRWLANPRVSVAELWSPLVRPVLQACAGQEVLLALDPTPRRGPGPIYVLGLVSHKRVLPLAWHVVANQRADNEPEEVFVGRMCRRVASWLPECTVTLVADRGLTRAELIRLCQELGWHWVLRVSADDTQGPKLPDGRWLWDLVDKAGQRLYLSTQLFKSDGWIPVELTIFWKRGYKHPWILVSDRPAGLARVREYRRRWQAEATYADCKTRGWRLNASRVTAPDRVERLLLVLALAVWWTHTLGRCAIKRGLRPQFDRTDRRDLSVMRLGRLVLDDLLLHDRLPPVPFAQPLRDAAT